MQASTMYNNLNFLCLVKRIKLFWRTWLLFLKNFLHILYLLFLEGVSGSSNGSSEHLIRAKLLENYDKIVLPVTGKKMEVRFKLRIVKLLKVVSITQQRNRNGNQNCRNSRGALNGRLGRELCHRGLQTPTLFKTEIAHFPISPVFKTCRRHYFPTLICFAYRIELFYKLEMFRFVWTLPNLYTGVHQNVKVMWISILKDL